MTNQQIKKETPQQEKSLKKIVANTTEEVNEDIAIAPIKEGSKYFMAKTWLSEKQVLKILQKTPVQHIYKRPGKGGQQWDYVTGNYVEKVLNYVFGWNWDFEIIKQEVIGVEAGWGQIITTGRLTVKDDQGHQISKTQVGRKDVAYKKDTKIPLDLGNDYKASATDCLKKCASLLGIASDIYGKQEFKEIKAESKPQAKKSEPVTIETKAVEVKTNIFEPLFVLARSKGAKDGGEAVFIQESLGVDIDWANLTEKTVANYRTQLLSKLTPRR